MLVFIILPPSSCLSSFTPRSAFRVNLFGTFPSSMFMLLNSPCGRRSSLKPSAHSTWSAFSRPRLVILALSTSSNATALHMVISNLHVLIIIVILRLHGFLLWLLRLTLMSQACPRSLVDVPCFCCLLSVSPCSWSPLCNSSSRLEVNAIFSWKWACGAASLSSTYRYVEQLCVEKSRRSRPSRCGR